jgi:hypothetical protein
MLISMTVDMKISTAKQPRVDLEEFSSNPAIARAVGERLEKLRARQLQNIECLVRQARKLRRKLIKEASIPEDR